MQSITQEELEEISSIGESESQVFSLYLNTTPPEDFKTKLNSLIHREKMKHKENKEDKHPFDEIEGLIDRTREHIENLPLNREETKLLACFASEEGFWGEYQLPVSLPSRIHVGSEPYLRPLSGLLEQFERHGLLVVDKNQARLFTLQLGEIEEHLGIFEDDVPDSVSTDPESRAAEGVEEAEGSSWAGWRESKVQQHIEDQVQNHLEKTSERLFEAFKRKSFDRLIVAGPQGEEGEVVRSMVDEHLHSYLEDAFIGSFPGDPDMNESELLKRANDVAREYEREKENGLISELISESQRSEGYGVLGLEEVLSALRKGQIKKLVVDRDFRASGYLCQDDHILALEEEECPKCGGEMDQVKDFADEMIEEVIERGGDIQHIFSDHEDFSDYGIGAFLRFRV